MQRRNLFRRPAGTLNRRAQIGFLAGACLLGGGLILGGAGCGGDNGDEADIPLQSLSMANADQVDALIDQAITSGTIPPQLEAILQGVETTLTPAQQDYLDSLSSDDDSDSDIDVKADTLFDQLLTVQNGDAVYVEPQPFVGDADRIDQALQGLPFQAGLPTAGGLTAGDISEATSQPQLLAPLQASPFQSASGCDQQCFERARRQALRRFMQEKKRCNQHHKMCLKRAKRGHTAADRRRFRRLCNLEARNCARAAHREYLENLQRARANCGCHDQGGGG